MQPPALYRLEAAGEGKFALAGVLGFSTVTALLKRSRELFDGQQTLAIDLKGVTQADSAGLALLLEWLSLARSSSRQIEFLNLPEQIRALARISEVETLLGVPHRPPA
jgi:phospholipid transport system transporter-binding protein